MTDIIDSDSDEFAIERQRILPGELNDDKALQDAFGALSNRLKTRIGELKEKNPGKKYFRSSFGYEKPLDGGAEVTVTLDGDTATTDYEWRQGVERHDIGQYKSRTFSRLTVVLNSQTGIHQMKLDFLRAERQHTWIARSDEEGEMSFQRIDINSADLLPVVDDIVLNLETLLDPKECEIEALDKTPPSNGLAVILKPEDKARWN